MNHLKTKWGFSTTQYLIILIASSYLFSFVMRLIWIWQFKDNPSFFWNDQLMINTNDGYFFASGAQRELFGLHTENPRVFGMWDYGLIFFTTLFAKLTPFSLETIILYMPAIISSLVVIPIILITRLYGMPLWGFFAALLSSIAWSYYNRTMIGYFDTDMFAAMATMFILYFLMKSTIDFNLRSAFYAALAIVFYPFLYDQGLSIVYAIGIIYGLYMVWYHRNNRVTYASLILVLLALIPLDLSKPLLYIIKFILLFSAYIVLRKKEFSNKQLILGTLVLFAIFMWFGQVYELIYQKIFSYVATGTKEVGLHFFAVNQTVREAGHIPFSVFANRISGSQLGLVLSLIGYIILLIRYRAFLLALPLIGIGGFALFGGLRFTVYAVPVAAISLVYLFYVVAQLFTQKSSIKYGIVSILTVIALYPNIIHIINYKVPTVFNKEEVKVLKKLDQIASEKDYTISWWDYGYPIWYYSDTNTLIDGGKHNNDNFIVSKILTTDSQLQAANLARLGVETYVDSNYSIVADTIFKNGKADQVNPNILLEKMKSADFPLPPKTRDVYFYLPQRMLNIFPTIVMFSNLDLVTGNRYPQPFFYSTGRFAEQGNMIDLGNGIVFNKQNGVLRLGQQQTRIKRLVIVGYENSQKLIKNVQQIDPNGVLSIIYMKSYNLFLVLDEKMYNSLYIQLFVLENYDKELFEPVVMSPYAKVYRLKK